MIYYSNYAASIVQHRRYFLNAGLHPHKADQVQLEAARAEADDENAYVEEITYDAAFDSTNAGLLI